MATPELVVELIRHAESELNKAMADPNRTPIIGGRQNETEISRPGERQARNLRQYAADNKLSPTLAYRSPAKRCERTHDLSSGEMGLVAIVDDRLQELDQGEWTNQPRTLYDNPINKEAIARLGKRFAAPGGQSMDDVADSMEDFLNSLAPTPGVEAPEYIWVHTHGVAIKALVGRWLDWSHERTYKTAIDNVSRTRVVRQAGVWSVAFINKPSWTSG